MNKDSNETKSIPGLAAKTGTELNIPEIPKVFVAAAMPDSILPSSPSVAFAPMSSMEEPGSSNMRPELAAQIKLIVDWAKANKTDANNEAIKYWSLKMPIILAASTYAIFSFYEFKGLSLIAGTFASICTLIDGLIRPGQLYKFYRKAEYELMALANEAKSEWSWRTLEGENPKHVAAEIIKKTEMQKQKISDELTKVSTTLGELKTK